MRAQWILGGLLVAGCIDTSPDIATPPDLDLQLGSIEANDNFGSQMVAGDFNGDGRMDLAVAAGGEGVSGHPGAGAVFIYKGTASGLVPWQLFTVSSFGNTTIHDYDLFGFSLAAREMTGDSAWELVVGAPGYWAGGKSAAGAVFTFKGSTSGLIPGSVITESAASGTPEEGDMFGLAVAMGKYDGVDNMVAVGAPGEKIGSSSKHTGWVSLMSWLGDSLLAGTYSLSPPSDAIDGALFGNSLLTINYNGDSVDDLVVGAPNDGVPAWGIVRVYRGRASNNVVLAQEIASPEDRANFGLTLATGRFHNAGTPELAIASPFDLDDDTFPGAVYIYIPDTSGTFGRWDTLEPGGTTAIQFGDAMAAGDFDGDGSDELAVGAPDGAGDVMVFHGTSGIYTEMPLWGTRTIHSESYSTGSKPAYGSAIAIADFDRTTPHHPDMAVGVESANVHGISFAGLVDTYAGAGGIPTYTSTLTEGN